MRFGWFTGVILLVLSNAAMAGGASDLRKLLTGADNRGWEAVGRLDIAGRAFCTGALIAPDLVLTAAHCLFDKVSGAPVDPEEIEFLAGWRNGQANAVRRVSQAIAHPDYRDEAGERRKSVGFDLALLRLVSPIRKASVEPFETDDRPRKGSLVGVVSYARERSENPSLQEECKVLARRSGMLVLSCDVDFGSSGAPVFSFDEDGKARIVSVISAKADIDGREVALGTRLKAPLADLMALVANGEAPPVAPARSGVKVFTLGGGESPARTTGGAKFVRP